MSESREIRLWQWRYTDGTGKRRQTRYRLTEADALSHYAGRDPQKVEHSLEVRPGNCVHTSDFFKRS